MIFQKLRRCVQLFGVMLVVGFSGQVAPAQTSLQVAKVALQPDEIALEGQVLHNDVVDNKYNLRLKVKAFWLPNGRGQKLSTPRERTIVLREGAVSREVVPHEKVFSPSFIGIGTTVLVVGQDGGSGSALLAREVVSLNYVRTTPPPLPAHPTQLIEYSKLKLWKEFKSPEHPVLSPAISPDGRLLATSSHGKIGFLNLMTGGKRTFYLDDVISEAHQLANDPSYRKPQIRSTSSRASSLQFSPDGQSLYISFGVLMPVVNIRSGHVTKVVYLEGESHFDVAWDEKTLVAGQGGGHLSVVDLTDNRLLRWIPTESNDSGSILSMMSLVFSQDHKSIIGVGADVKIPSSGTSSVDEALTGTVRVWDTWSWEQKSSTRLDGIDYWTTKLSPHGKYVFGGVFGGYHQSKIVRLWNVAEQRECGLFEPKYTTPAAGFIADLDVSQDENTIAVLTAAYRPVKPTYATLFPFQPLQWGTLHLWRLPGASTAKTTPPLWSAKVNFEVNSVLFCPDGRGLIVTGTRRRAGHNATENDSVIQFWRVPSSPSSTRIVAPTRHRKRKP